MNNEKSIYLARHAKSSWNSDALNDFDRPLSQRGEQDVLRVGAKLHELNWLPEKIIASPATRAKQTSLALCDALKIPPKTISWEKELYAAYTVTLIQCLAQLPESVSRVMLVGHNPSMEDLLTHLCGASSVNPFVQTNGKLFTTANVAKITLQDNWCNIAMADAQLVDLIRPKML